MARPVPEKISKFVQDLYYYVLSYTILNCKFYGQKYKLLHSTSKIIQFIIKINSPTFF